MCKDEGMHLVKGTRIQNHPQSEGPKHIFNLFDTKAQSSCKIIPKWWIPRTKVQRRPPQKKICLLPLLDPIMDVVTLWFKQLKAAKIYKPRGSSSRCLIVFDFKPSWTNTELSQQLSTRHLNLNPSLSLCSELSQDAACPSTFLRAPPSRADFPANPSDWRNIRQFEGKNAFTLRIDSKKKHAKST